VKKRGYAIPSRSASQEADVYDASLRRDLATCFKSVERLGYVKNYETIS
jgi:hypothetical protein